MSSSERSGIVVDGLSRVYEPSKSVTHTALDGISFSAEPGEVLALLGPNGAGKTTLARILTTLLLPSSGTATVGGYDVVTQPREVQRRCGVAFGGETGLYGRLSAADNLRYHAVMYQMPRKTVKDRIAEVLELVQLSDRAGRRVETFSRGMKQRLHIARAILHDPDVVILDEPSAGLDASAASALRELVKGLGGTQRTILLMTHDLREAEELCQRVGILVGGELVRFAAPQTLRREATQALGVSVEIRNATWLETLDLDSMACVRRVERGQEHVTVFTDDAAAIVEMLFREAPPSEPPSIQVMEASLEAAYLQMLGGAV